MKSKSLTEIYAFNSIRCIKRQEKITIIKDFCDTEAAKGVNITMVSFINRICRKFRVTSKFVSPLYYLYISINFVLGQIKLNLAIRR